MAEKSQPPEEMPFTEMEKTVGEERIKKSKTSHVESELCIKPREPLVRHLASESEVQRTDPG